MRQNDSEQMSYLFSDVARDWTPAPARLAACVLYAPFLPDAEVSRRCTAILSEAEQKRAAFFVTEEGKAHFVQRRAFRRYCGALALGSAIPLSQILFNEANGRPYLADLPEVWFSFSACRRGFLGAWSSSHAIGVDLEDQTRNVEAVDLARRYFSEAEANAIQKASVRARLRNFIQLWSLKEAALKSVGEGLPFGLDAFTFELSPTLGVVHAPGAYGGARQFVAQLIEDGDNCAAVVLRQSNSAITRLSDDDDSTGTEEALH